MNIFETIPSPHFAVEGALTSFGSARNAEPAPTKLEGDRSNLEVRLSSLRPTGSIRTVTLEGVGCPVAMCSRVAENQCPS